MTSNPKPRRAPQTRKPLRRWGGSVGMRTLAVRTEFLRRLLLVNGEANQAAVLPSGTRLAADGGRYVDPRFASALDVTVLHDPSAPPYRTYTTCGTGHVHHEHGRNHGQREDIWSLVLLDVDTHRRVTAYEQSTGRKWGEGSMGKGQTGA